MEEPEIVWDQFQAFLQDCILPTTASETKTRFKEIYDTYLLYCEAISQGPLLAEGMFARRFNQHIHRRIIRGTTYYFCTIRENLFIKDTN